MNSWINLHALWKIVALGLLAGAGLPALFAVGLRALSTGPRGAVNAVGPRASVEADGNDDVVFGGSVPGLVIASFCFAVVLAAIGLGIYSIVSSS
jgi:hypothetical protein